MNATRFTLADQSITVHDGLYSRPPTADEAQSIRDALEGKRLPWWLEYGAVLAGILALVVVFGRGVRP